MAIAAVRHAVTGCGSALYAISRVRVWQNRSSHGLLRDLFPTSVISSANLVRAAGGPNAPKGEWTTVKTKQRRHKPEKESGDCSCVTYATADKYNIDTFIHGILKDERFSLKDMPLEFVDAANIEGKAGSVLANPNFPGEMFIFRNGVISFWNVAPEMVEFVLKLSRSHAQDIYPVKLVKWENEEIAYSYEARETMFHEGKFALNSESSRESQTLEMFAFSNALCSSVKLGHWEYSLDSLITSLETIPVNLIKGQRLKYETPAAVLRKIGEILLIRHRVNLQHNLLDLPDAYWDHEDLEKLYLGTARFLNIDKRVHLMNEKLTYCAHMVELLRTDLHEKRSLRVEILIVLLISIEVVFEVIHLFVLPYIHQKDGQTGEKES